MAVVKRGFKPAVSAEAMFSRALRKVARVSGHIVEAHVDGSRVRNTAEMRQALESYSKLIDPWARRQAAKMLEQVSRINRKQFKRQSKEMGRELRLQVAEGQTGELAQSLMNEHVELIKSIPVKAAIRAQELSTKAVYEGKRADEVAQELLRSTRVSESQAELIARTEVARANASITQARAVHAGAQGYIWRTTLDGAERESHAKMNGKYVAYDKEPTLIDGTTGHAGTFPNCRCYQDPVFDDT